MINKAVAENPANIGGLGLKKRLWAIAAFAIALAISIGPPAVLGVQAEDTIKIDIKVGFDKFYKIGFDAPVYFEVENNLRDIKGELQIEIPSQSESIFIYAMNVSLPKDSTKKFVMNVPMNVFNTKLKVNITEGKNVISTKTFRIDPGSSMETRVIGILSDDFDPLKYINRITLEDSGNFASQNVRLDETSFPDDINVLKAFDVIVINNFDTSKLSSLQYETLKKWVVEGGTLIIGTGPSQNKTLAAFKDDFITGEIGEAGVIVTSSLSEMINSSESFSINVVDISIKDSLPVIRDGDSILLQKIQKGRGVIGVFAFDFGMEPLSTWAGNNAFADKAIVSLLPPYNSDVYNKGMSGNMYAIDNALRNIPELPLPRTSHMMYIYAAYILLAAPASYILLKRLDRRELMWVTVPVLSIIFSAAVYFSGAGTRLTGPVTNIISLIDVDNSGVIAANTYAGVFTPNKENLRIEAAGDFDINPLKLYEVYHRPYPDYENEQMRVGAKITVSPKKVLEFYKGGIWSMKTLTMEGRESLKGKLESNLNYSKGVYSGTVSNNSGFDLDECYIIANNHYINAGPIKNGEEKQINAEPSSYFGHRYDLINAIYRDQYSGPVPAGKSNRPTEEEMVKLRQNNQKRQLLEYGLISGDYKDFGAELIAWSSTPVLKKLLVNGKSTKSYEKSLITARVNLNFRNGNSVEYPMGFIKPIPVKGFDEGKYDEYSETFYGMGSIEIHYPIDENIKPENIKIQFGAGKMQGIKQYLWDNENGDWVLGEYRDFEINSALLKRYLGNENILRMKIEMEGDSIQLPQIAVKGSVK